MKSDETRPRPAFQDRSALLLALSVAAVVILFSAAVMPVGFQGRDDFRYLMAADRWLSEGVHTGANHWANRLPYVLTYAGSFAVLGENETALVVLHSLLFFAIAAAGWVIGRQAFGENGVALSGLLVVLFTPFLFRLPTTFYPEALEVALAAVCVGLVLARHHWVGKKRLASLTLAGILGGTAILVRQTAIAVPLALAAIMLIHQRDQTLLERIKEVGFLALGFTIPVLAELAFYTFMTGNPLHRLIVDSNHVKIPSISMKGGVYEGSDGVLFNWDLAAQWQKDGIVDAHWTLVPLVRLFFSPGMLLTPWLALLGGILAWKAGGRAQTFALLTLLTFLFHYSINTFVLVIAPNTRYFGLSLLLMCPLAGFALTRVLPARLVPVAILAFFVMPTLLITMIQPRPVSVVDGLEQLVNRTEATVYLTEQFTEGAALRLRSNPDFAARTSAMPVPIGGLVAWGLYDPSAYGRATCPDGSPAFISVDRYRPPAPIAAGIDGVGLASFIPSRLMAFFRRESDAVELLRRNC